MDKLCSRCEITKPIDLFSRDIRKKDGRNYLCKSCVKAAEDVLKRRRRDSDSKARLRNRGKAREQAKAEYQGTYECAVLNCHEVATDLHHVTYEDAFAVIPLCDSHHRMNHSLCKIDSA